jgi:Gpi18-like mannosyltransferase
MKNRNKISLKPWQQVLIVYGIWKIVLLVIGYFAAHKVGLGLQDFWARGGVPGPLLHTFKYDADWYNAIATNGYTFNKSAPAFYPLFPALIALVSYITKLSAITSAFVVNMVAGYFAFYYLYKLAMDYFKKSKPSFTALLLFAFFPTAYFMHAMYGEALFCAIAFAALFYARQEKWLIANIFVAFGTATRLPGLITAAAVGMEYLASIKYDWRKINKSIFTFLLAPLGFIMYALHLRATIGDLLGMFNAYNYGEWSYQKINFNIPATVKAELLLFWDMITNNKSGVQAQFFDELTSFGSWLLLLIGTIWGVIRKIPIGYLVFMVGNLILLGSHSTFTSTSRYVLGMFPLYILLAEWLDKRDPWVAQLFIAASANVMTLMFVLFANGIWTA